MMSDILFGRGATLPRPPPAWLPSVAPPPPSLGGFRDAYKSLVAFDSIRITRLCEIVQYAFLFSIAAIFAGTCIDRFFSHLYPAKGADPAKKLQSTKQATTTALTLALQVAVGALTVFYIRKIADLVPPLINLAPTRYLKHRNVSESQGEMSLSIAFVGIQTNAVLQLQKLRDFYDAGSDIRKPEENPP